MRYRRRDVTPSTLALLLLDRKLDQDQADGVVDGVVEEYDDDLSLWDAF